jgi:hypothetical protein
MDIRNYSSETLHLITIRTKCGLQSSKGYIEIFRPFYIFVIHPNQYDVEGFDYGVYVDVLLAIAVFPWCKT